MFWNSFKYNFLNAFRQKDSIFWMMCFPIILATFFYMAFSDIYENDEMFNEIPVAVVETTSDEVFDTVMAELSGGESPLFKSQYTDEEKALQLLESNDVSGIIYVGDELSLSVASSGGIQQTIIKSFLEQYKSQKTIITETAVNNPEKLQSVINVLSAELQSVETKSLSNGNMDIYVQYFYNLIAMVALFGASSGIYAATENQGNLSAVGARKCVAPIHKLTSITSHLLALLCLQIICAFISISYILFILKVNMGDKIPMIYLSGCAGSLLGVSLGFLLGSIGIASEAAKAGSAIGIIMTSCFLSGLMVGDIKGTLIEHCPVINMINPASVISDLFYCLIIYDDYKRYLEKMSVILIMSFIFIAGGFLLNRRKKYASL